MGTLYKLYHRRFPIEIVTSDARGNYREVIVVGPHKKVMGYCITSTEDTNLLPDELGAYEDETARRLLNETFNSRHPYFVDPFKEQGLGVFRPRKFHRWVPDETEYNFILGHMGVGVDSQTSVGESTSVARWIPPQTQFNKLNSPDTPEPSRDNEIITSFKKVGASLSFMDSITGPRFTRYLLRVNDNLVDYDKLIKHETMLAMDMHVKEVRLDLVPEEKALEILVPNASPHHVYLYSIFETEAWKRAMVEMELPIVLGKNLAKEPVIVDLANMPHLLIAGATGSGKSVLMHNIIRSLYNGMRSPFNPYFMFIDLKGIEFSEYDNACYGYNGNGNGLPVMHFIDNSEDTVAVLPSAIIEMNNRYDIIDTINRDCSAGIKTWYDFMYWAADNKKKVKRLLGRDYEAFRELEGPVIIIIDEWAELFYSAGKRKKELVENLTRIAQKGRAAGLHLILATQSPRSDVLTGAIKANFPARIALAVATNIDSRVILDRSGAEKLLGNGDMLFNNPQSRELIRIQAPLPV